MKIPANVIDQLITGAQSDIRQVLNMLSTWKLSNDTMDFDEGKDLYVWSMGHMTPFWHFFLVYRAKMNQKHSILSPFDITSKLLGPYVYSATSRETLGDKMEYYFQDHSFVPLFIQVCVRLPYLELDDNHSRDRKTTWRPSPLASGTMKGQKRFWKSCNSWTGQLHLSQMEILWMHSYMGMWFDFQQNEAELLNFIRILSYAIYIYPVLNNIGVWCHCMRFAQRSLQPIIFMAMAPRMADLMQCHSLSMIFLSCILIVNSLANSNRF